MLRFDKMKITAPIWCVKHIDESAFAKTDIGGKVTIRKYRRSLPSELLILLDYNHNELSLEFTGRILGDSYPLLINMDTFMDCLRRIEDAEVISLDRDGVFKYGKVTKCDVTYDVSYSELDYLIKFIKANLSNYNRWEATKYLNGVELHKKVSTKRCKQRLVIYNKEKELEKAANKSFISTLSDKTLLRSYFKGKVRFERSLNTEAAIRGALNIEENYIEDVLSSSASPIADFLKEAIKPIDTHGYMTSSVEDIVTLAVLNQYNFDLTQVEAAFRAVASKNTRMSRLMKRYQEFANRRCEFDFNKVIDLVS